MAAFHLMRNHPVQSVPELFVNNDRTCRKPEQKAAIHIYIFFLSELWALWFCKVEKISFILNYCSVYITSNKWKKNKFLHRIKLIDLNKLYGVLALDSSLLYALSMLTNNFGTLCIQGETLILYINSDWENLSVVKLSSK